MMQAINVTFEILSISAGQLLQLSNSDGALEMTLNFKNYKEYQPKNLL